MKLFRLTLVVIFVLAFTILACSEESTPTDTGTPDNLNTGNVCNEGVCATNATKKQECEDFLDDCLAAVGDGRDDECVGSAWLMCEL